MGLPFLKNKTITALEFLLLCIVLPSLIIFFNAGHMMFVFLWAAAIYCWIIYKKLNNFDITKLWGWRSITAHNLKFVLIRWGIVSCAMYVFMILYSPERTFNLLIDSPTTLIAISFLYPLLSALPQEFIFCGFFFKRYKAFFGENWTMIFLSALVFAYAHVLYINPIAPTLSFIGGLIFAYEFRKHQSLALVTLEHSLYGISLFITGLGWYFYSGAISS